MSGIYPFDFVNLAVRGRVVRLESLDACVPTLAEASQNVRQTLGEMLAVAAMLAHDAKRTADVTIQLQHAELGALMFAQCNTEGALRAYANAGAREVTLGDMVAREGGVLAVTFTLGDGQPYQSLIPLESETLAGCMVQYFDASVQTLTHLKVLVGECVTGLGASALMLQQLPGEAVREDDWSRMALLLGTLTPNELLPGGTEVNTLLAQLFAEDDVRVYEAAALVFERHNPRERMLAALASLPREEVEELLAETGDVRLLDEVSGREEVFTRADLLHLLVEGQA